MSTEFLRSWKCNLNGVHGNSVIILARTVGNVAQMCGGQAIGNVVMLLEQLEA